MLLTISFLLTAGTVFATSSPTITSIGGTNFKISLAEKGGIIVSGAATTGDAVSVVLTDSALTTASSTVVAAGGVYSATIDGSAFVAGAVNASVTANDGETGPSAPTLQAALLDEVAPTITSSKITGANRVTIVFSEEVFATSTEFSDFQGSLSGRSIVAVIGSGTNTLFLDFDGSPFAADASGTLDVAATLTDLAGNPIVALNDRSIGDGQVPVLAEVTAVPLRTTNQSPTYVFSATEAGAITYAGACDSGTAAAIAGSNSITLRAATTSLPFTSEQAYNDCTIKVTDGAGNQSSLLSVSTFTLDLTAPTFTAARTGLNTIVVTFNENVSASDTNTAAWSLTQGSVTAATQPATSTTLTLTTSGLTGTLETPTLTYVAASGSVVDLAGTEVQDGYNIAVTDEVEPTLLFVQIRSSNANPVLAKVGDTVTISATSSEPIALPTVTIAGQNAAEAFAPASTTEFSATYTFVGSEAEGVVPFTINFADIPGNAGAQVTATTNATAVTFDKTAPSLAFTSPFADSFVRASSLIQFTNSETTAPVCSVTGFASTTCSTGVTTLGDVTGFAGLGEGAFSLLLGDTDPAGNTGSTVRSLVKDTIAPTAPNAPTAAAGSYINDAEEAAGFLVVVPLGTSGAVANDTLELLLGGSTFPAPLTGTINGAEVASGTKSFTIAPNQLGSDGVKLITARVIDQAGNQGATSTALTLTLDTTAPTAAITYNPSTAVKDGTVLAITAMFNEPMDVTVPQITISGQSNEGPVGMTFASTTVATYNHTVVGGGNGAANVSLAVATDLAGNTIVSAPTSGTSFTVDNTNPTITSITTVKPDGFYASSTVIDFTVVLSEPVVVAGTPTFPKISLNSNGFAEYLSGSGTNTLTLRYTVAPGETSADLDYNATISFGSAGDIADIAGNNNGGSNPALPAVPNIATGHAIVIDTTAPSATPVPVAPAGALINAAEYAAGVTVMASTTGSGAVAGDTLELLLNGSSFPTPVTRVLTAGEATNGYIFTISSPQFGADGAKNITSRVVDQAGNLGTVSTTLALTLDTAAPAAPVITSIAGNNKINASERSAIAVIGTAEANASISVTLTDQNATAKNMVVSADGVGAFSTTIDGSAATAFVDGVISPSVTATDAAGNVSAAAVTPAAVLDSVAPAAPSVSLTSPVNIANQATTTVSGTGEGNALATYIITDTGAGRVAATASLSAGGVLSVNPVDVSALLDGTLTLAVSLADDVGNRSATTTATASKDTVTPVFSGIAPANSAFINNVTTATDIAYTISENLGSGTVVFTRTGGTADPSSPQTCTLAGTSLASGARTLNVADTTNGCTSALALADGAVYSIAFSGSDTAGNPSAVTTRTGVTFDATAPVVTFIEPIAGTTIGNDVTLTATTSEAASCSSSLDGAGLAAFGTTGGTSHTTPITGLLVGGHTLAVSCSDPATNTTATPNRSVTVMQVTGASAVSTTTNIVLDSTIEGQTDLPDGVTGLILGNSNSIDLTGAVSTSSNGILVLGGAPFTLSSYTGGNLVAQNLSAYTRGTTLMSGTLGENIQITNANILDARLSIPDGTTVFSDDRWDGHFIGPRGDSTAGDAPAGFIIDNGGAYQFGSLLSSLLFDKPVTIEIPVGLGSGQAAFKAPGATGWTPIADICAGSFATPTAPVFSSECRISNASTTKIVTWHLTAFASMHPVPPVVTSGANGPITTSGGGGGGGGGSFVSVSPVAPSVVAPSAPSAGTTGGSTSSGSGQVLGVSTFRFTRNLFVGSRGADVTELQKRLAAEGLFLVRPTGYFGPATKAAVIAYQKKYAIKPTLGFVGPLTRSMLNK